VGHEGKTSQQNIQLARNEMFLFEYLKMTTYFEEDINKKDAKHAMFTANSR
jgi:hypothetical protein